MVRNCEYEHPHDQCPEIDVRQNGGVGLKRRRRALFWKACSRRPLLRRQRGDTSCRALCSSLVTSLLERTRPHPIVGLSGRSWPKRSLWRRAPSELVAGLRIVVDVAVHVALPRRIMEALDRP